MKAQTLLRHAFVCAVLALAQFAELCVADDWLERNGTQYLFANSTFLDWSHASIYCQERGMELATPRDNEENAWMTQQVKRWRRSYIWIGVNDNETEDVFVDMSGQPVTYTNWRIGFPRNSMHTNCVELWDDGRWYDFNCESYTWNFMCKTVQKCTYNPCHPHATCFNSTGVPWCTCSKGYIGNGTFCEDIDECRRSPCHPKAACSNTNGSYTCQCESGYSGDGWLCEDLNECSLSPCSFGASCVNTAGSYRCECQQGFKLNGAKCEDIDECLLDPCDPNASCSNTAGSFMCLCNDGFTGDGLTCEAPKDLDGSINPCDMSQVTLVNHPVSDIPERSANATTRKDVDKHLLCDIALEEGWYVFLAPSSPDLQTISTMNMPTRCVREYHCNTKHPIWMRGDVPSPNEGSVSRQACLTVGDNCCAYTFALRVKACNPQMVAYYLSPPTTCASAYCFGEHMTCPPGQVSPTGFTPGCQPSSITELQSDPIIKLEVTSTSFEYTCLVSLPTENDPVIVDVMWLAGMNRIDSTSVETQRSEETVRISNDKLSSYFGKQISCKARYFTSGFYSQWRQSSEKLLGIEVVNYSGQPFEVDENDEVEIKLKLHAPYLGDLPLDILAYIPGETQGGAHCSTGEEMPQLAVAKRCGTQIIKSNWNDMHTITVRAAVDSKIEQGNSVLRIVRLQTPPQVPSHSDWANYRLPEIKVLIKDKDEKVAVCRSTNDPHMTSFDGRSYELQKEGEFVLYRHKVEPLEVHAQYKSCGKNNRAPYCNCAVGILAAGDVITFDKCGRGVIDISSWRSSNRLRVAVRGQCNKLRGTRILQENGGRRYVVQLHTGTSVIIEDSYWSFINLYVEASLRDLEQTEGLCGHYDLDCSNDLIPKGSHNLPPGYGQGCYGNPHHPHEFTESWKLGEEESILHWNSNSFKDDKRLLTFDGHVYCTCDAEGVLDFGSQCRTGGDVPQCNPKGNQRDVSSSRFESCRRRRDTSGFDHLDFLDYEESDYNFVSQPRPEDDMPFLTETNTRSKRAAAITFTNETAYQHCHAYIFNTVAGQKCIELNIDTDVPIAACVLDLLATNDPNWASAALDTVKQQCMSELDKNTTRWVPKSPESNVTVPPPDIEGVICFNECNGKGACINGSCVCDEDFAGPDCSINMTAAPLLFYSPMCDLKSRPCKSNPVIGNNFLENDKLTCHFYQQKIGPSGLTPLHSIGLNKSAAFENYAEVTCPLPEDGQVMSDDPVAPIAYKVHVSNDGMRQSRYGVLIVFNSVCFSCDINNTTCTENESSCKIEDKCYAPNERDPKNQCNVCDPAQTRTSWTFSPPSDRSRLCVISNKCYLTGQTHHSDICKVCDPTRLSDDWSVPIQSSSACIVDGMCYKPDQENADDTCMICDPQQSTTSWSMSSSSRCLEVATATNIPPLQPVEINLDALIAGTSCGLIVLIVAATVVSVCAKKHGKKKTYPISMSSREKRTPSRQEEHVL